MRAACLLCLLAACGRAEPGIGETYERLHGARMECLRALRTYDTRSKTALRHVLIETGSRRLAGHDVDSEPVRAWMRTSGLAAVEVANLDAASTEDDAARIAHSMDRNTIPILDGLLREMLPSLRGSTPTFDFYFQGAMTGPLVVVNGAKSAIRVFPRVLAPDGRVISRGAAIDVPPGGRAPVGSLAPGQNLLVEWRSDAPLGDSPVNVEHARP